MAADIGAAGMGMRRSRGDRMDARAGAAGAALVLLLAGAAPAGAAAGDTVQGDAARGARVFQRCYACHSVDPAETTLQGPNLHGVVGRPAGAVPDFDYSDALLARGQAGLVWDERTLDAFLADPRGFLPGNAMGFFGLDDPQDRADVIAYLRSAAGTGPPDTRGNAAGH